MLIYVLLFIIGFSIFSFLFSNLMKRNLKYKCEEPEEHTLSAFKQDEKMKNIHKDYEKIRDKGLK